MKSVYQAPYEIAGDNRTTVLTQLDLNRWKSLSERVTYIPGRKRAFDTEMSTATIRDGDPQGSTIAIEWTVTLAAHTLSKKWSGTFRCELCTYFIDMENKAEQTWINMRKPYNFRILPSEYIKLIGGPVFRRPMPTVEDRGALLVNFCLEQGYRVVKDFVEGLAVKIQVQFVAWQPDNLYKRPQGEMKADVTVEVNEESGKIVDRDFDG